MTKGEIHFVEHSTLEAPIVNGPAQCSERSVLSCWFRGVCVACESALLRAVDYSRHALSSYVFFVRAGPHRRTSSACCASLLPGCATVLLCPPRARPLPLPHNNLLYLGVLRQDVLRILILLLRLSFLPLNYLLLQLVCLLCYVSHGYYFAFQVEQVEFKPPRDSILHMN